MNWNKILIGGVAAGIVFWLYGGIVHGVLLADNYANNALFNNNPSIPWMILTEVLTTLGAAILFDKTRTMWADGFKGGATYGAFLGLVVAWPNFINTLVINGFSYPLSWYWAISSFVGMVIVGAILGQIIRRPQ